MIPVLMAVCLLAGFGAGWLIKRHRLALLAENNHWLGQYTEAIKGADRLSDVAASREHVAVDRYSPAMTPGQRTTAYVAEILGRYAPGRWRIRGPMDAVPLAREAVGALLHVPEGRLLLREALAELGQVEQFDQDGASAQVNQVEPTYDIAPDGYCPVEGHHTTLGRRDYQDWLTWCTCGWEAASTNQATANELYAEHQQQIGADDGPLTEQEWLDYCDGAGIDPGSPVDQTAREALSRWGHAVHTPELEGEGPFEGPRALPQERIAKAKAARESGAAAREGKPATFSTRRRLD